MESTDRYASERPRAIPAKKFYPGLPMSSPPTAILQLSFPSLRRHIFFSFEKRRIRELSRRGIVSLEYIQITGGAESHRRFVGVPAIISQVALSRATSSIPPFCWINLLVVYISLRPFSRLFHLSFLPIYSCPFLLSYYPPVPFFSIFFPFRVSSLFHFLDFPPSPSSLPFPLSRFSAIPFDYSVIVT